MGHTTISRALIVKGFWLDKIFDNGKIWEMRSSLTGVRGRIGLIESGTGTIVGEADLIYSLGPLSDQDLQECSNAHQVPLGTNSRWRYAWVLRDAVRYENPVPYAHPRGAVIWVKL